MPDCESSVLEKWPVVCQKSSGLCVTD